MKNILENSGSKQNLLQMLFYIGSHYFSKDHQYFFSVNTFKSIFTIFHKLPFIPWWVFYSGKLMTDGFFRIPATARRVSYILGKIPGKKICSSYTGKREFAKKLPEGNAEFNFLSRIPDSYCNFLQNLFFNFLFLFHFLN